VTTAGNMTKFQNQYLPNMSLECWPYYYTNLLSKCLPLFHKMQCY